VPGQADRVAGSARALRRLIVGTLDEQTLDKAMRASLRRQSSARIARNHGIHQERARVLTAGAPILRQVQAPLDLRRHLANGSLREGVALSLLCGGVADARASLATPDAEVKVAR